MKRTSKTQSKVVAQPTSELQTLKSDPVVKLETPHTPQPVTLDSSSSSSVADVPQKPKRGGKKSTTTKEPVQTPTPTTTTTTSESSHDSGVSSHVDKLEQSETPTITIENLDAELLNVDEFDTKCAEFYAKLQELTSSISTVRSEFKSIEKIWAKKIKTATKTNIKKKKKSGNRAPSGFVKPTKISDELAVFLNKPVGTEMARTEVTREINLYIRANKLQDTTNGRKINADQKLSQLLQLPVEDELTYFNLQKYMSVHFPKTPVAVVAPVV